MTATARPEARSIDAALRSLDIAAEYAPGEVERAAAMGLRPLPRLTYGRLLDLAVARFGPDHVLFEFPEPGSTLTVGELSALAHRFARALTAAGFRHGDSLAVWSPPAPLWPVAMFGAGLVGVRVCGLNTRYRREELRHVLGTLRPSAVVVATGFLDIDSAGLVAEATAGTVDVPLITGPVGTLDGDVAAFLAAGDAADDEDVIAAARSVDHRDAALVQFTSGSTGAPKGVLITQSGSVAAAHYGAECMGLDASDVMYSPLPFFHIGGTISTALAAVASGCRAVVPQRFDAAAALARLARDCTAFQGHQALWRILLDEYRAAPVALPRLRKGWASGDYEFMRALHDELGVTDLIDMYGSSEAGTIACTVPSDPIDVRLGSLGRLTPGTRGTVRGPDGAVVAAGEVGELWLSGVMAMRGYLGEDEADSAADDGDGDGDSWIRTGDLVRCDGDVLRYAGRADDRLKPGGENVSVAEVESFIARDPGVVEVVVVGVPDRRLGVVPAAVVRVSDPRVTPEAVTERCRAEIAGFKVPRHVRVVDTLPTLDTGKVDRRRVRAELLEYLRREKGVAL